MTEACLVALLSSPIEDMCMHTRVPGSQACLCHVCMHMSTSPLVFPNRGHVHAYARARAHTHTHTHTNTHTHTHTGMMGMDGMGGMEDMWRSMYEGMRQMYERGGDMWGQQSGVFSK
jgi:hypothetical protein